MARGLRLTNPGVAWLALTALLGAGALVGWWVPAVLWDWQPALAFSEPWRAVTAAFVHWSPDHLFTNLGAAAVVGAFGYTGRMPARAALAWALAWPPTHWGLLLQPALAHYGGLSGVLHTGVAVALVFLLSTGPGPRRTIAAMVTAGLIVKLVIEQPWGPPLRQSEGWDIALAPLAHATGSLAGAVLALLVLLVTRRAGPRQSAA